MEMTTRIVTSVLLVSMGISVVAGLRCWSCVNMEADTRESIFGGGLDLKSDPNCVVPQSGVTQYNTCPDDGYHKCAYIEAKVKASFPLVGSVTFMTNYRGCIETTAPSGCHGDQYNAGKKILNEVLKVVVELGNVKIENYDECFCDDDLCDPRCLLTVANLCIQWYMVGVAGGGILLLVALCACCCCCCCRQKSNRGRIIHQQLTPVPVIIQTSTNVDHNAQNGIQGLANPMYGVN